MELVKFSEAYTLLDNTDSWMTGGGVTVEADNTIKINLHTTLKAENPEESNQWGSAYYQRDPEGKVQTQYSFEGAYQAEYVNYCEDIFVQIFEKINK